MRAESQKYLLALSKKDRVEYLIKTHLWVVHDVTIKACRRFYGAEYDEIESYALEGLWRAAKDFNPDLGRKFSTYAHLRASGAVIDAYRAMNRSRRKHHYSGVGPLSRVPSLLNDTMAASIFETIGDTDIELGAVIADTRADLSDSYTLHEAVEMAIQRVLKPKEQQVIYLTYYFGYNQPEIGRMMGVTSSRVAQIQSDALMKLRRYLGITHWQGVEGSLGILTELLVVSLSRTRYIEAGSVSLDYQIGKMLGIYHRTAACLLEKLEQEGLILITRYGRRLERVCLAPL